MRPCGRRVRLRFDGRALLTCVDGRDGWRHLLISNGRHQIRLDVEGSAEGKRALLRYDLAGRATAERPLMTLRRLIAFGRRGAFAPGLHRPSARTARWVLQLRAHDALAEGCDQRDIASELLSHSAALPRWRSRESSIRSQVQRLVREARAMADGGYRKLLR